jgi:O-antigen ligase
MPPRSRLLIAGLGHRGEAGGLSHGRPAQWHDAIQTAVDRPVLGSGADTYFAASRKHQGATASRYAHDLPLESWAELGLLGLGATLALYGAVGLAAWRARARPAAWLFGPAAVAFLVTNLLDWPWHLAGAGALWALALGGLLAPAAAGPPAPAPGVPRTAAGRPGGRGSARDLARP